MSLEVPPELSWVAALLVGQRWPQGDEDGLRALGEAWGSVGQVLSGVGGELGSASAGVVGGLGGTVAEEFAGFAATLGGVLPQVAESATGLGRLLEESALEVETGKLMLIFEFCFTMVMLWMCAADGAAAEIPAVIAAARVVCTRILLSLVQAMAFGAGFMVGADAVVQAVEFLEGHRHTWSVGETLQALEMGALSGAVGGAVAELGRVVAPRFAGTLKGKLTAGAVAGVVTTGLSNGIEGVNDDQSLGLGIAAGAAGFLGGRRIIPHHLTKNLRYHLRDFKLPTIPHLTTTSTPGSDESGTLITTGRGDESAAISGATVATPTATFAVGIPRHDGGAVSESHAPVVGMSVPGTAVPEAVGRGQTAADDSTATPLHAQVKDTPAGNQGTDNTAGTTRTSSVDTPDNIAHNSVVDVADDVVAAVLPGMGTPRMTAHGKPGTTSHEAVAGRAGHPSQTRTDTEANAGTRVGIGAGVPAVEGARGPEAASSSRLGQEAMDHGASLGRLETGGPDTAPGHSDVAAGRSATSAEEGAETPRVSAHAPSERNIDAVAGTRDHTMRPADPVTAQHMPADPVTAGLADRSLLWAGPHVAEAGPPDARTPTVGSSAGGDRLLREQATAGTSRHNVLDDSAAHTGPPPNRAAPQDPETTTPPSHPQATGTAGILPTTATGVGAGAVGGREGGDLVGAMAGSRSPGHLAPAHADTPRPGLPGPDEHDAIMREMQQHYRAWGKLPDPTETPTPRTGHTPHDPGDTSPVDHSFGQALLTAHDLLPPQHRPAPNIDGGLIPDHITDFTHLDHLADALVRHRDRYWADPDHLSTASDTPHSHTDTARAITPTQAIRDAARELNEAARELPNVRGDVHGRAMNDAVTSGDWAQAVLAGGVLPTASDSTAQINTGVPAPTAPGIKTPPTDAKLNLLSREKETLLAPHSHFPTDMQVYPARWDRLVERLTPGGRRSNRPNELEAAPPDYTAGNPPDYTAGDPPDWSDRDEDNSLMYSLHETAWTHLPERARTVQGMRDQLADALRIDPYAPEDQHARALRHRQNLYAQALRSFAEDHATHYHTRDTRAWHTAVNRYTENHQVNWDQIITDLRAPGSANNAGVRAITAPLAGRVFGLNIHVQEGNNTYQIGDPDGHPIVLLRNGTNWQPIPLEEATDNQRRQLLQQQMIHSERRQLLQQLMTHSGNAGISRNRIYHTLPRVSTQEIDAILTELNAEEIYPGSGMVYYRIPRVTPTAEPIPPEPRGHTIATTTQPANAPRRFGPQTGAGSTSTPARAQRRQLLQQQMNHSERRQLLQQLMTHSGNVGISGPDINNILSGASTQEIDAILTELNAEVIYYGSGGVPFYRIPIPPAGS
ncbi:WXG100-like domain-containing protein [Streptomyces sp. NPDC054775]